ncbi:helix-turn-helix transcriptional regulator [Lachnospiraceae bacterium 54-53]
MKTLETNDWMVLNSIIYKIYTTENFQDMRADFLEQLKLLLDFDSADFFLASRDGGNHLIDPVYYNCSENMSLAFDELDYSRGIMYGSGKSMVYRETDIISDEKRMQSEYYRKVYRPNNWHYSLQLILGKEKRFLGVVTFYRNLGKENFQYDDIFLLDMLKDHLAYRLFRNKQESSNSEEKMTVSQASEKFELTKREQTILKMLMEGKDSNKLGEELSISINTLKKHILNIYRKLGVKNRVQLFKMIKEKE